MMDVSRSLVDRSCGGLKKLNLRLNENDNFFIFIRIHFSALFISLDLWFSSHVIKHNTERALTYHLNFNNKSSDFHSTLSRRDNESFKFFSIILDSKIKYSNCSRSSVGILVWLKSQTCWPFLGIWFFSELSLQIDIKFGRKHFPHNSPLILDYSIQFPR